MYKKSWLMVSQMLNMGHSNRTCCMQTPSSREVPQRPGQLGSGSSSGFLNPLCGTQLYQTQPQTTSALTMTDQAVMAAEIQSMIQKQAIQPSTPSGGFISSMFLVPKRRWPEASNQPKTSKRICTQNISKWKEFMW